MTNKIALFLGALLICALLLDWLLYDLDASLYLARKFVEFVEWLKFWR